MLYILLFFAKRIGFAGEGVVPPLSPLLTNLLFEDDDDNCRFVDFISPAFCNLWCNFKKLHDVGDFTVAAVEIT